MEDNEIDVNALRAEVAELRAKAAEQAEEIARYKEAGSGDILAAIERMEQRLAPPMSKDEKKVQRLMQRGYAREDAEAAVARNNAWWERKKKRENNWKNVL